MKALRYALADAVELVLTLFLYLLALPVLALTWLSNLRLPGWTRTLLKIAGWLFWFLVVHRTVNWFFIPQRRLGVE